KLVCRDMRGVVVTLIADNYFGYSKKEIKSQISYAANLLGDCEEEHAGGALAFPCVNLGDIFSPDINDIKNSPDFESFCQRYPTSLDIRPEGYALDKRYTDIVFIPASAEISIDR